MTNPAAGSLAQRSRSRPVLVTRARVAGAVAIALLAGVVFAVRIAGHMPDFEVYWTAGARAASGEALYRAEDGHYVFKYLPAFAVLAIPLGLLPLPAAQTAWFATCVVFVVVLLAQSIRLLPERRKPAWVIAGALLVALGKFFGHELVLGQVNLLLAVTAAGALLALKSGRDATAGALVALAIVVKPYAAIFLPWLAARRRTPAITAAAAGCAGALLLPALVYGWDGSLEQHRAWWTTVTATTPPNLFVADNVSLASAFARILGTGPLAARLAAVAAVGLLGVAVIVFAMRRNLRYPDVLEGALLLTLIPLISPQGWDYVFLVSAPALALLVNYEDRLPPALRVAALVAVAAIGLSLYDVMGRTAYRAFMEASAITWLYLVVIAALAVLRARRIA